MDEYIRFLKHFLIDIFINGSKIFFFWVPGDEKKGEALKLVHGLCAAIIFILIFISNRSTKILILILLILAILQQAILGCCVVTKAEQVLTKSKETILDPVISAAGYEVNNDTRFRSSVLIMCTGVVVLSLELMT
jgi:hypothetical protein